MAIMQCKNGHYYDDEKYPSCPHCGGAEDGDELTASFIEAEAVADGRLAAMVSGDEKTVGFYQERLKSDPVVGWLVCTEGPERGRDYRIYAGRNFLGRSHKMDIAVLDDPAVARENHCSIVFDPLHGDYMIVPGEGTGAYLKGGLLTEPAPLEDGCVIGIGGSSFVFIAFCREGRSWL